jgi:tetratricopeptide (TPR) repeat protein
MALDLDNRIIGIGNQVVFGAILPQRALEMLRENPELRALPDDALRAEIEETERYCWERLNAAVHHPENVMIYAALIAAAAQDRLKAIGQFRAGLPEKEREAMSPRMADWITLTANCMLAEGMARLLLPDPQGAWQTFMQANVAARALPDSGRLRLRETLWAAYGLRAAAVMGGQDALRGNAEAELSGLMHSPGREEEAQGYLAEIRTRFDGLESILHRRQTEPEEDVDRSQSDDPEAYGLYYAERLNYSGGLLLAKSVPPLKARDILLDSIDLARLEDRHVYYLSLMHRNLSDGAPDRGIIMTGLNYAVAARLRGPRAELTRGYCAYALGYALAIQGRQTDDRKTYRRAIRFHKEALAILAARPESDAAAHDCALVAAQLAICHRGIGDFRSALIWSEEAIRRNAALPPEPKQKSNLGVAYGNLADVQEKTGDPASALANHYRAFELFMEARDLHRVRQALFYYSRLCQRMGRFDDVMAATARAAEFMEELADTAEAVRSYLWLAQLAFTLRRHEAALHYLQRAEDLLGPKIRGGRVERVYLELYGDLAIWEGYVFTLMLGAGHGDFTLERALQPLERARQIALALHDDDRLANAVLQMSKLYTRAGQLDQAESLCLSVNLIPCGALYKSQQHDVYGTILLRQRRFDDAIPLFEQLLAVYASPEYADRLCVTQFHLGEAHAGAGRLPEAIHAYESAMDTYEKRRLNLFESSRLEVTGNFAEIYDRLILLYSEPDSAVYNSERALHWLEKSKSRTLVEAIGLTRLPLRESAAGHEPDLQEETSLLEELNSLRGSLFASQSPPADSLERQRDMQVCLEKLQGVWDRLAASCPEYVELRRGDVADWSDLRSLLAA